MNHQKLNLLSEIWGSPTTEKVLLTLGCFWHLKFHCISKRVYFGRFRCWLVKIRLKIIRKLAVIPKKDSTLNQILYNYIFTYIHISIYENPSFNVKFRTLIEQKQDILAMDYPLIIHINNPNFIPGKFKCQMWTTLKLIC